MPALYSSSSAQQAGTFHVAHDFVPAEDDRHYPRYHWRFRWHRNSFQDVRQEQTTTIATSHTVGKRMTGRGGDRLCGLRIERARGLNFLNQHP